MKKSIALFLVFLMLFSLFSCQPAEEYPDETELVLMADDTVTIKKERSETDSTTPLRIGMQSLPVYFNPFCPGETDEATLSLVHLPLLALTEGGLPVSGPDYACLAYSHVVTEREEGGTELTFVLKNGVKTQNGEKLTADDLLAALYILLDPLYRGETKLSVTSVAGIEKYTYQPAEGEEPASVRKSLSEEAKGRLDAVVSGKTDDSEAYGIVWGAVRDAVAADLGVIASMSDEDGYFSAFSDIGLDQREKLPASLAAALYFGALTEKEGKLVFKEDCGVASEREITSISGEEAIEAILSYLKKNVSPASFDEYYDWNCVTDSGEGNLSLALLEKKTLEKYLADITLSCDTIEGITKDTMKCDDGVNRERVSILFDQPLGNHLWDFTFSVLPKSAYPIPEGCSLNAVGMPFASAAFCEALLSLSPDAGTGPYARVPSEEEGKNAFVANENFLLGRPEIKNLLLVEVSPEESFEMIFEGKLDLAQTTASPDLISRMRDDGKYASLGWRTVDYFGYGYIGINSSLVSSLPARRALLSTMDPTLALLAYTEDLAECVTYPTTHASWTYPDHEAESLFDETGETAKKYLLEAGYSYEGGRFYEQNGMPLSFTYTLASELTGQPAGRIFLKSQEIFSSIGVLVEIVCDPALTSVLTEGTTAVWSAAWTVPENGDLFDLFCSDRKLNALSDLPEAFGLYDLLSGGTEEEKSLCLEINEALYAIRLTSSIEKQKELYAELFDRISELAVELPVYQRRELYVYSKTVLDEKTLPALSVSGDSPLPYREIWRLSLLGK